MPDETFSEIKRIVTKLRSDLVGIRMSAERLLITIERQRLEGATHIAERGEAARIAFSALRLDHDLLEASLHSLPELGSLREWPDWLPAGHQFCAEIVKVRQAIEFLKLASRGLSRHQKPFRGRKTIATVDRDVCLQLREGLRILDNEIPPLPGRLDPSELQKTHPRHRRNRRPGKQSLPRLTEKQLEAYRLFGETSGNMTEVAKRMGVSRQAAQQHYEAAGKKMALVASHTKLKRQRFTP